MALDHQGPPIWAGLSLARPLVMGIVNVTPDSFSDPGDLFDANVAIAAARRQVADGADIVDIGGESTRPGAAPVPADEQLRRILPVVEALAGDGATVSIDTSDATVMRAAVLAGARIVNDVAALAGDPAALQAVAGTDAAVVLMHKRGPPVVMQQDVTYVRDVVVEVRDYLAARLAACIAAGIAAERVALDPGIGFGKSVTGNLALIARLGELVPLGRPLLVGVSRKSFIGKIAGVAAPKDRLPGSLAAALKALDQGARILRVHDVAETVQAVRLWAALNSAGQAIIA